jgi:hypothetical protein
VRYEPLEEAGTLSVVYSGPALDLFAIGVLQANLQEIFDKVAFWLSAEAGLVSPDPRRRPWRGLPPWQPPPRIVRGELKHIAVGSLTQEIAFVLAAVLSDPDVRAILQGFAGNVVFAIARTGLQSIQETAVEATRPIRHFWRDRQDPADLGANVRSMAVAVAESVPNGKATIRIKARGRGMEQEVVIMIDNRQDQGI